jgi:hypothetical protein
MGFLKLKPEILIEFESPIRVLHYNKLIKQYEDLMHSKLPNEIINLLQNKIKEAESKPRFKFLSKWEDEVTFYEELAYGINSEEYFKKLHPYGITAKDWEKLRIKITPDDYFVQDYKIELGLAPKERINYDELLELPLYCISYLLNYFKYPIPPSSIHSQTLLKSYLK